MIDLTKIPDEQKPQAIEATARVWFDDTFRRLAEMCGSSEVIEERIKDPLLAESIEKLGQQGYFDSYIGKQWRYVAGIDIRYAGTKQGLACHQFILEIDGQVHDTFLFPFQNIRNASGN